jgi:soluble lytic murein transglycosylase-like protein
MSRNVQLGIRAALVGLCAMMAFPCWAAESAVLRNGFSIRYERQQNMGLMTRLYVNADGSSFVDVPTVEIDHIETAPDDAQATKERPAFNAKHGTEPPVDLDRVVATASDAYRLDPDLVNSVIRAESGFNVRAVSPKGAQGLMQLMPQTASQLGVQNAFDPQANVEGGTRYLRELLERYNFDLIKALAAYNAGPERVERYGGVPPYYETKAYVARIVRDFNKKKLAAKSATQARSPKGPASDQARAKASAKANSAGSKTRSSGAEVANNGAASR